MNYSKKYSSSGCGVLSRGTGLVINLIALMGLNESRTRGIPCVIDFFQAGSNKVGGEKWGMK
jgi:hypothetical protein